MVDNVHARASVAKGKVSTGPCRPQADPIRRSRIKNQAVSGLVDLEIWFEAAAHIHDTTEGYDSRHWSEMVLPIWRSIVKTVFN